MEVHSNDMVGASAREEVGDQCAGLSNPLAVANLGLESWRLGGGLCDDAGGAIGAIEVYRVLRLVRVECLAATETVALHGARRVRGAVEMLVHLHATELVVQSGCAIGAQACALRLAGVRCLRARLEAVGACSRARARDPGERCVGLVVGDV